MCETFDVELDDLGVHTDSAAGLVRWRDLVEISIVTNDQGPFLEDLHWVFRAVDGTTVWVTGQYACHTGLLGRLQARFGDTFDNEAVIQASMCVQDASFVCWRRPPN